jgi:hypothetical protein
MRSSLTEYVKHHSKSDVLQLQISLALVAFKGLNVMLYSNLLSKRYPMLNR